MTTQILPLGDICEFTYGDSLKEDIRQPGKVPVYGSNGIVGWHNQALTRGNTIIVGRKGSIGEINWSDVPCFPIDTTYFVDTTKRSCRLKWLYYALLHLDLTRFNKSAAVPGLNRDDAYEQQVVFPGLQEQEHTERLLNQADRLRRMRRSALQMCDELLPSTFIQMFGDPALNPHSFPVTEGEQLFDVSRGGAKCGPFGSALKNSEYVVSGIPVWTMENVQSNSFLEDGCLYITEEKFEKLKAYAIKDGDILISRAGTVGRTAIVRTEHKRSIMHSNLIRLALDSTKIIPEYYVVLMTWFGSRVAKLKTGQEDAYTFMNTGTLGELPIPLPPMEEQRKFLAFLHRHQQLRAMQVEAVRQSEHLFQTLLHRAFSASQ